MEVDEEAVDQADAADAGPAEEKMEATEEKMEVTFGSEAALHLVGQVAGILDCEVADVPTAAVFSSTMEQGEYFEPMLSTESFSLCLLDIPRARESLNIVGRELRIRGLESEISKWRAKLSKVTEWEKYVEVFEKGHLHPGTLKMVDPMDWVMPTIMETHILPKLRGEEYVDACGAFVEATSDMVKETVASTWYQEFEGMRQAVQVAIGESGATFEAMISNVLEGMRDILQRNGGKTVQHWKEQLQHWKEDPTYRAVTVPAQQMTAQELVQRLAPDCPEWFSTHEGAQGELQKWVAQAPKLSAGKMTELLDASYTPKRRETRQLREGDPTVAAAWLLARLHLREWTQLYPCTLGGLHRGTIGRMALEWAEEKFSDEMWHEENSAILNRFVTSPVVECVFVPTLKVETLQAIAGLDQDIASSKRNLSVLMMGFSQMLGHFTSFVCQTRLCAKLGCVPNRVAGGTSKRTNVVDVVAAAGSQRGAISRFLEVVGVPVRG